MPWVRIDDRVHDHPKFRLAWELDPASIGLEMFSLSHSAAYLLDGDVPKRFVNALFYGRRRARDHAVDALIQARLWVPNGTGWHIHDYLDYNESREVIEERRRVRDERRRARRQEWEEQ